NRFIEAVRRHLDRVLDAIHVAAGNSASVKRHEKGANIFPVCSPQAGETTDCGTPGYSKTLRSPIAGPAKKVSPAASCHSLDVIAECSSFCAYLDGVEMLQRR